MLLGALTFASTIALCSAMPTNNNHIICREPYDLPLVSEYGGFFANLTLGTPPQPMTALVDWTWMSSYVITTKCLGSLMDTSSCFTNYEPLFNSSLSTTFKNETDLYPTRSWDPNHFFFDLPITVNYASDVLGIGPHNATVTVQAADFQFNLSTTYPFDFIFGLAPVFAHDNASYQPAFYQEYRQGLWPAPLVAFHQCYPTSPDPDRTTCAGHDAIQTFGGLNPRLVGPGGITWYDVIAFDEVNLLDFVYTPGMYNYWNAQLTGFSVGDEVQLLNQSTGAAAIFDHASYGVGAPMSVNGYAHLVEVSNATLVNLTAALVPNNGVQEFYAVDCAGVAGLPVLKYTFAGSAREWEITPANYVEEVEEGVCVLNVRVLGYGDMIIGNFGSTFARDKYVVFDFEELKVGLADLAW